MAVKLAALSSFRPAVNGKKISGTHFPLMLLEGLGEMKERMTSS
jgi:hypothetical protein